MPEQVEQNAAAVAMHGVKNQRNVPERFVLQRNCSFKASTVLASVPSVADRTNQHDFLKHAVELRSFKQLHRFVVAEPSSMSNANNISDALALANALLSKKKSFSDKAMSSHQLF